MLRQLRELFGENVSWFGKCSNNPVTFHIGNLSVDVSFRENVPNLFVLLRRSPRPVSTTIEPHLLRSPQIHVADDISDREMDHLFEEYEMELRQETKQPPKRSLAVSDGAATNNEPNSVSESKKVMELRKDTKPPLKRSRAVTLTDVTDKEPNSTSSKRNKTATDKDLADFMPRIPDQNYNAVYNISSTVDTSSFEDKQNAQVIQLVSAIVDVPSVLEEPDTEMVDTVEVPSVLEEPDTEIVDAIDTPNSSQPVEEIMDTSPMIFSEDLEVAAAVVRPSETQSIATVRQTTGDVASVVDDDETLLFKRPPSVVEKNGRRSSSRRRRLFRELGNRMGKENIDISDSDRILSDTSSEDEHYRRYRGFRGGAIPRQSRVRHLDIDDDDGLSVRFDFVGAELIETDDATVNAEQMEPDTLVYMYRLERRSSSIVRFVRVFRMAAAKSAPPIELDRVSWNTNDLLQRLREIINENVSWYGRRSKDPETFLLRNFAVDVSFSETVPNLYVLLRRSARTTTQQPLRS